ncbi:hypothetical protein M5K25_012476 [Dendrobium thyrsiflorum]|uniref:Uncharacterized protein n=1 Tax=Dendrobium thyrsiflorum TaxID=117978 RepID=A0ABD0UXM3_DENTH
MAGKTSKNERHSLGGKSQSVVVGQMIKLLIRDGNNEAFTLWVRKNCLHLFNALYCGRDYYVRIPDTVYRPEVNQMQPCRSISSSTEHYRAGGDMTHFYWTLNDVRRPYRIINPIVVL